MVVEWPWQQEYCGHTATVVLARLNSLLLQV